MGAHQPDQTSGMRSHIRSGIGSDSHAVRNEVDKEVRHEIRQAAIPDEIMAVPAIRHNESDKASAVLVCMLGSLGISAYSEASAFRPCFIPAMLPAFWHHHRTNSHVITIHRTKDYQWPCAAWP